MATKWWTLAVVCLAVFMLLLDVTIVNVALPDIQKELGSSFEDLQWVVDAYALALAAILLASGSLGDLLGRRSVFVLGLVIFSSASLVCGLSGTPTMLNIARAVQGAGGAMMFANSLALIAQEFPANERGTALGIWGATTGFAVAVGPLVGGVLTDGLGWEWIFLVNVPIGVLTLALTLMRVRNSERDRTARIDWAGLVTFSAGLFCLVFALIRGNDDGWGSSKIVALLVAGALLLAAFVAVERRRDQPLLDLRLFRIPTFTGAQIVAFSIHASIFSMFLYITLYMQNILGYTPLEAGIRFLPVSLLSFVAAPIAGKLAERYPVRVFLTAGLALIGLGLVEMHGVKPSDDWTTLLPGFILAGIGIGFVNPPLATAAIGVVEPRRSGAASGINSTARQVGTAVGIAGLGAILQSKLSHGLGAGSLGDAAAAKAYIDALDDLFLVAAAVAFAGAACAAALIRRRDFVSAAA
ncbi:MAG TPA: MFS transporter [Thermoleophilaceae bacterium]|nr:MFS transporter [Thermoleophilaceae bacterium]